MKLSRFFNLVLLPLVIVFGILAVEALTKRDISVASAASRDRQLTSVQAARRAMDMIKSDLERAGYAETIPAGNAVAVRVKHAANTPLTMIADTGRSLSFRSNDGREEASYELEGRRLIRVVAGERQVLVEDVRDFKVRPANESRTIDIAFWIPAERASRAAAYGHFVRAAQ